MNAKCRKLDDRKPRGRAPRPALDLLIATTIAFLAWLLVAQNAHAATESPEVHCVSGDASPDTRAQAIRR